MWEIGYFSAAKPHTGLGVDPLLVVEALEPLVLVLHSTVSKQNPAGKLKKLN